MAKELELLWTSDVHFNFFTKAEIIAFLGSILRERPDGVVISGDVCEAHSAAHYLRVIADALPCPIYFVLGNHDYYHGSIAAVREEMQTINSTHPNLFWLPVHGVIELTSTTAILGHGSYADARYGNYADSTMMLNDYYLIEEFKELDHETRGKKLNALGDGAAAYLEQHLSAAMARYKRLIVVTHPPPFREATLHMGEISNGNALPHFSCKAVGDVLLKYGQLYPRCDVTVLCGHTHGGGDIKVLDNLRVVVSASDYEMRIEKIFVVR